MLKHERNAAVGIPRRAKVTMIWVSGRWWGAGRGESDTGNLPSEGATSPPSDSEQSEEGEGIIMVNYPGKIDTLRWLPPPPAEAYLRRGNCREFAQREADEAAGSCKR